MKTYLKEYDALVSVKMRPTEKAKLEEEARMAGMSLSAWCRVKLGIRHPHPT